MHPADIKAALEKRGLSQTAIAKRLRRGTSGHVVRSAVCRVINGSMKSQQIARAIAGAIEQPVSAVFPGQYPELEFIERAALTNMTATQAAADLTKLQRPGAKPAPGKRRAPRKDQP